MSDEDIKKIFDSAVEGYNREDNSDVGSIFDSVVDNRSIKKQEYGPIDAIISGGAQGATMGTADNIEAVIRSAADKKKEYKDYLPEVKKRYEDIQKQYPITYGVSELGGSLVSPFNSTAGKIGGYAVGQLSKVKDLMKYEKLLSMAKAAISGGVQGAVAGAGYSDGDLQSIGTGAGISSAISTVALNHPMATLIGATSHAAYNMLSDDAKNTNTDELAALGITGLIAGLGKSKKGIDLTNKLATALMNNKSKMSIKAQKMMNPLENYEQEIEKIGERTPIEQKGDPVRYKGSPMTDKVKKIYREIEEENLKQNDGLSSGDKSSVRNQLDRLGELRYVPIQTAMSDKDTREKVLKTIEEINKIRGVRENAITTYNKQIETLLSQSNGAYSPAEDSVSSFIVARMFKPAYSHAEPMRTALAYGDSVSPIDPRASKMRELSESLSSDVKAGILNKWYQPIKENNAITEDVNRYFNKSKQVPQETIEEIMSGPQSNWIKTAKEIENEKTKLNFDKSKQLEDLKEKINEIKSNKKELINSSGLDEARIDFENLGDKSRFKKLFELFGDNDNDLRKAFSLYKNNTKKLENNFQAFISRDVPIDEAKKLLLSGDKNSDRIANEIINTNKKEADQLRINTAKENLLKFKEEQNNKLLQEQLANKESSEKINNLESRLYNMYEGKRQLGIQEPIGTIGKITKYAANVTGVGDLLDKFSDLYSQGGTNSAIKVNKNLPYYRQKYGEGKTIMNDISKGVYDITPEQISQSFINNPSFLKYLSKKGGSIGSKADDILETMMNSGGSGVKEKLYLLAIDPDFRRLFSSDKANQDHQNQDQN